MNSRTDPEAEPIKPTPDHSEEGQPIPADAILPERLREVLPVLGLGGGSAGGLPALQAFFAAMPATLFLDADLRITLFTPSAAPLFNLIATDVGRPLSDLANRLDYPQIGTDARSALERGSAVEREVRAGEATFLSRVVPYTGRSAGMVGVVFTFLDITESKRAADALRASEAQLRTIVAQAAAGVAHLALDGQLTLVNQRFADIAGVEPAALVGRSFLDLLHPDHRPGDAAALASLAARGEPAEIETRLVRPNGQFVWVSAALTRSHGAARPRAIVAILVDIDQRKRKDRHFLESEERLRLVVENAREYAILWMDLDRHVRGWNTGAEALTGFSEAEMLGGGADVIFVPEDREAGVPDMEASTAIRDGRAADERWHLRKDGTRFWGSGVMMAMHSGDEIIGLLKIFRDQTAARAAHEAIEISRAELVQALVDNRRARTEAEAASHAKDRFLAILSHELRTPLTPIVLALHALERTRDMPPTAQATLDLIRRNVTAELRLIDDLLDVTRISSGKLELVNDQADMHQVVRAAGDFCEADFAAKQQRFELRLAAGRHGVRGDAHRLQQVVWNVLKNASKFTPPGGSIRVDSRNEESRFVLAITDTGIGIDSPSLSVIFDAFAQEGEWVTSEYGGLGLGLAIAKATVEAHHGTLSASSAGRNQGATFTIELPLE